MNITFLQLAVSFWTRSLSISKKLSARTWVALALIHAMIAIAAFSAYRAKTVSDTAIPPVAYTWYPGTSESFAPPNVGSVYAVELTHVATVDTFAVYATPTISQLSGTQLATVGVGQAFNMQITGLNFGASAPWRVNLVSRSTRLTERVTPRPATDRIVIERTVPQAPSLFDTFTKEVALIVSIITTILAIMNGFLAWMVYKRGKAQDILLQLQIAKITAELEQMRADQAKAAQESQASPLIVLS